MPNPYYAKNYAGILDTSLPQTQKLHKINKSKVQSFHGFLANRGKIFPMIVNA